MANMQTKEIIENMIMENANVNDPTKEEVSVPPSEVEEMIMDNADDNAPTAAGPYDSIIDRAEEETKIVGNKVPAPAPAAPAAEEEEFSEATIYVSKEASPYDDIIDGAKYTYNGTKPILDNLISEPEVENDTSIWSDIKVGFESGSSVGQFVANRELYGSNTYNTEESKDKDFELTSPEVAEYLTGLTPDLMEGVEDSVSFEHMELIVSRNRYDAELRTEYNDAGSFKYAGLVGSIVADPINVVPMASAFKLLNGAKTLTKVAGYGVVGASAGSADEALRGTMQQTDYSIGSGAFWGGVLGLGLGGVSHLLSRSINKQGAAESMLDPQASKKAAKVNFMYTPTQRLTDSGSNEFSKLGKTLNRGPINKEGEVLEATANDIKYNIANIGAQSEASFKDAYKSAISAGYSGTYDDYLEDGLGEIIGATHYVDRPLQPVPTNEFHTSDVLDKRTASRSVGGNVQYVDLSPEFIPLQEALLENNVRLSKYLDDVLPSETATFKVEAGEKLTELNNQRLAKQDEINILKKEGKETIEQEIQLKYLSNEFTNLKKEVQVMTDANKLKAGLTQGASNLTKYFTINTKAIANMSIQEFTNTVWNSLAHSGELEGVAKSKVIISLAEAHKEIVAKYTRGDTEDFIINQMTTYNEDPLFPTLISKLNPLDVKGIMYSDAGIASHYFHTELAGNTGLVAKGMPLNDDAYRDILEGVAERAIKNEGMSAEEARELSTQALDLYRQIRGDYMPMPSAGGYGQAVKAFNNLTYSAVGGGFGLLSAMDISVGVTANGFRNTVKAMGPAFTSMIKQVQGKDPKAIQEALQLGAGGEMMMGSLKSRFFELDGVATSRTMAKTMAETTNSIDKLVAGTDWLADKVSTVSGLRHVSSWLQYTAMYASMGKIAQMAKKGTLSVKEIKWLADKGLTQSDIQSIPTDKMTFDKTTGKPIMYNFTEWGSETLELQQKMVVASNRAVNNAVIKADTTELPNWFNHLSSSPTGSMLTAFLKYVVASHGSIMKRGYYGDKARFFSGVAVAGSILMISKVAKEEALVASGIIEEKDRKYRLFDSRGNIDEEGLTKLAVDTVSYLPQMGAVSLGVDTAANWANTDIATGDAKYSGNQTRILGNFNNVLSWGKYLGKAGQGEVDAIDSLYQFKSATPFNNLYYIDQMYMPKIKDELD